jgi:hypothetical protein
MGGRSDDDSKVIGILNWESVAVNRETWDKRLRKAVTRGGLLRQW